MRTTRVLLSILAASTIGLAESSEIWRGEVSRVAVGRTPAQAVRATKPSQLKLKGRLGDPKAVLVDLESFNF